MKKILKQNFLNLVYVLLFLIVFFVVACNEKEMSVSFSVEQMSITEEIEIPIEFNDASLEDVEFVFSDPDIVEIVGNKFVPLKAGETIITVCYGELRSTMTLIVLPTIQSEMSVNERVEVDGNCEYDIEDEGILQIVDGQLKAISMGTTSVTITLKNNTSITNTVIVTVTKEVPICKYQEKTISINDFVDVGLENFDNEDYTWTINDKNIAELYDDYYLETKGLGTIVITIVNKTDSSEVYQFVFEIIPQAPRVKTINSPILIGDELDIVFNNDYTLNDVTVTSSDNNIMTFANNKLVAVNQGTVTITIANKEYPNSHIKVEYVVHPLEPVINLSSNKIVVGTSKKLSVLNYSEGYTVDVLDDEIVKYENGLLVGLKKGSTIVKVSINDTLYTEVEIEVIGVSPEAVLTYPVITTGSLTGIVIKNLEKLDYQNVGDYTLTSANTKVATITNNNGVMLIKGVSKGTCDIIIEAKEDNNIQTTVTVTVVDTSDKSTLTASIENITSVIKTGDMLNIKINNVTNNTLYQFVTSDQSIATINENGRLVTTSQGIVIITIILKSDKNVKLSLTFSIEGTPNINYIDRIISIAEEEIGYKEGTNNDTKYGDWYGMPNEAWCAMFVSWCAYQAGVSTTIIPKYASCRIGMQWFVDKGQFGYKGSYTPKAGDIIFFLSDGASHTGLVIACNGTTVYTIEGNTSNMVAKRYYSLSKSTITGYGIPNYPKYDGTVSGGGTGGATDGGGASTT